MSEKLVSSQELSGTCNTNLPLAHHHTCSQQGPSNIVLFTEEMDEKKALNETENSVVLVFPLDLK